MDWWELGLVSRQVGHEFAPALLHCPYCTNKGHFIRIFRAEKRGETSAQDHTSDVWQCQSCAENLFVQWHTEKGMVEYRVYPQNLQHGLASSLPEDINSEYQQAVYAYINENWDVCVVLLKRMLDLLAQIQQVESGNLRELLKELYQRGQLTTVIIDWANKIEVLSSGPSTQLAAQESARELLTFCRWVLDLLYLLPQAKQRYR